VKLVSFFHLLLVSAARAFGCAVGRGRVGGAVSRGVVWYDVVWCGMDGKADCVMKSASADARLDGDSLLQ
jgi:hypothetical protein